LRSSNARFIPVSEPMLHGRELDYLSQCIKSGWISADGAFVRNLEDEVSAYTGRQFGISVSSGSAALEVAIAALDFKEGDEIIVPTHTIISCVSPLVRRNICPVLVDSDLATWNMNIQQIEEKITSRTKAIMVVHTYGLPIDMDPVRSLATKHELTIVEDAAQSIGLTYKGKPCGSFGDISTLSFYSNKHVTTGEGGMILCDDSALADRSRSFRNLCFQENRRFVHHDLGWNYRMSNLHAAVGLAQLEIISEHLKRKRRIGIYYRKLLSEIPGIILPPEDKPYSDNYFWVFGIILAKQLNMDATTLMAELKEEGIGTRPFFWPMHEQPIFQKMSLFTDESYPVAELMGRRGLYLPSGPTLTKHEQERVAETLAQVVRNRT